jgi:uncharacterized protein (UPF0276 family)
MAGVLRAVIAVAVIAVAVATVAAEGETNGVNMPTPIPDSRPGAPGPEPIMNPDLHLSPPSCLADLPVLGSGLGYRPPWFDALTGSTGDQVDFLEITADHFLGAPRWKMAELDALLERFTLIPHALDLSIGSAEGIDEEYLSQLAELIERINPPYWSEHLAFTKAGGRELGHLAPLPFCAEAVDVVARNAHRVREVIARPLILENITYGIKMPGAEMDEPRFLREILAASECGWLLDVTNLHINSINHDENASAFLDHAPLERVVQLHYVGFSNGKDGQLVDDHGAMVNPEIWDLLAEVLRRTPVKGAILERDQKFPDFGEIAGELAKTRELGRSCGRWG